MSDEWTPEKIAELRALCDAATPGPWKHVDGEVQSPCDDGSVDIIACAIRCGASDPEDGQFIAAARTALPAALAEIERLHARVAELEAPALDFETLGNLKARDLLAELRRREWQPIATAPQEEMIMVFCPDAAETDQILIAGFLISDEPGDPGDWYELNPGGPPLDVTPTHWQPLPEPPALGDENGCA